MYYNNLKTVIYLLLLLVIVPRVVMAIEVHTRYATIIYNEDSDLDRFNEEIYLGKYNFLLQQDGIQDVKDEVRLKTDLIVDRVKEILDMFPENIKFKIAVCASNQDINKIHKLIYGKPANLSAFYAPDIDIVFFSAEDTELATIAHEFAHVIMHKYFQMSPPVRIHELLSRYVATHIKD
jgi:hypothetical protein